jgi:hypothetical protein
MKIDKEIADKLLYKTQNQLINFGRIRYEQTPYILAFPNGTKFEYITHPESNEQVRVSIHLSRDYDKELTKNNKPIEVILRILAGPDFVDESNKFNPKSYELNSADCAEIEFIIYFYPDNHLDYKLEKFNIYEQWYADWLLYNIERIINDLVSNVHFYEQYKQEQLIAFKLKKELLGFYNLLKETISSLFKEKKS